MKQVKNQGSKYQPFSKFLDIVYKNIVEHNFKDKIEIVQVGCGIKSGKIKINNVEVVEYNINTSNIGNEIKTTSIEDLIKKYNILNDSILKIDCNVCENKIISLIPTNIIRNFSDIQIEYHNGYNKIKDKLEKYGFDVKITKLILSNILYHILYNFTNEKSTKKKIRHVKFISAKKMEILN